MFDSRVEVSVLDCTLDWPNYTQRFRQIFDNVEVYKVMKGEYPSNPDVVVITGSTYSVPWNDQWVHRLKESTEKYIESGKPVLGLCFGQQIIVEALGGSVVRMSDYEIGYKPVEFDETQIFQGFDQVEYPFNTHRDKVEDLPKELKEIARTGKSIQAVKHRYKPVYGVQFHPELTPQIAEKAIKGKNMKQTRKNRLLKQVNSANFQRAKRTLKLFENFLNEAENKEKPVVKP